MQTQNGYTLTHVLPSKMEAKRHKVTHWCVHTISHLRSNNYIILSLFSANGNEEMSEVLMLIQAESSKSHSPADKTAARFTRVRLAWSDLASGCLRAHRAFTNLGHSETHTYIATHPRATHPHCNHYDPSSSLSDIPTIITPKAFPFSDMRIYKHTCLTQHHTDALTASALLVFHMIFFQWTNSARRKWKWAYYTFQTSTVLAPCNLVLLTLLCSGQMEPY